MKVYNIDPETIYPDAKARVVPGYEDRAVIQVTNHMSVTVFYPLETEGWKMDGSMLFTGCMGFDPEEFDPESKETRKWVEQWSYPLEMAKAIVAQINA